MTRISKCGTALAAAALCSLVASVAAGATPTLKFLVPANSGPNATVAAARLPSGALALVYQTFAGGALNGLGAVTIGVGGTPGPAMTALAGWQAGRPALVAYPNGELHAFFGGSSPVSKADGVWEIVSQNGGATWTAPAPVQAGGPNEALAYGADATAAMTSSGPVLSLPQAGKLVVQLGLGQGASNYAVTNAADGAVGDVALATDAATGAVVAAWQSIAHDPQDYVQGVEPSPGALQAMPDQPRNTIQVAGRDVGAGVFAASTPDNTHVRLYRYGGGSVAVGSRVGTTAKLLGVATGIQGRMWVMWGDDGGGGIALTRSNKAVTRFEPIQHLAANVGALYRIFGDGRLGPLDLLVNELPNNAGAVPSLYYARVLPELAATVSITPIKNTKGVVVARKVKVTVTDAGDPVAGTTVTVAGKSAKTNSQGIATVAIPGAVGGKLSVVAPGYQPLSQGL